MSIAEQTLDIDLDRRPVRVSPRPGQISALEPRLRDLIVGRSQSVHFRPGESLFEQGAQHRCSFIIEQGLVRAYYTAASGREITLAYWSEGDIVGGPNFYGGGYHTWSGAALRPTQVLAIRGDDLKELANLYPQIGLWVTDTLMFKMRWMSILLQLHGTEAVQIRVARLILMLGDIYGTKSDAEVIVEHPINQGDLATLVGASRQWTNRVLKELRELGLVRMEDHIIRIMDPPGLMELAGDRR